MSPVYLFVVSQQSIKSDTVILPNQLHSTEHFNSVVRLSINYAMLTEVYHSVAYSRNKEAPLNALS